MLRMQQWSGMIGCVLYKVQDKCCEHIPMLSDLCCIVEVRKIGVTKPWEGKYKDHEQTDVLKEG